MTFFWLRSLWLLSVASCSFAFTIHHKGGAAPYLTRNAVVTGASAAGKTSPTTLSMSTDGDVQQQKKDTSVVLFGHPGTRSPLVNWACYELGVSVEMGDLSKNPHPFGQIPCLVDGTSESDKDAVVVFESGAILQYLQQSYGRKHLTPSETSRISSWIAWANASLDPICFIETPDGKVYDTGLDSSKGPNKRIDRLEATLESQGGLLVPGAGYSLADVSVASYLLYVVQFFPKANLRGWPNLVEYMRTSAARPAYAQAYGTDVQAFLLERLEQMKSPIPRNVWERLSGKDWTTVQGG